MFAFLVNSIAMFLGAGIGLVFKKKIKPEVCESVQRVLGVTVLMIGIAGVLKSIFVIEDGAITSQNELLLLVIIVIGTFIGEFLKIDYHLKRFGDYIEKKFNKSSFSEGFVNGSIISCVGAMAIVGSIQAALGDPNLIYIKSVIDGVTAIVLASTLGIGVFFSGFTILVYQGLITLLGYLLGDFMSLEFINAFSMIGNLMVSCLAINFIQKEKIKVANMLPAILLIILYFLIFK